MPNTIRVGGLRELPAGSRKVLKLEDRSIVVLNVNGCYFALGSVCPHRQGPLEDGTVLGNAIRCPWHGLQFELDTGQCTQHPGLQVPVYPVHTAEGEVLVDIDAGSPAGDSFEEYCLVRYGAMGTVGRFGTDSEVGGWPRGQQMIVQTDRGIELGELLLAGQPWGDGAVRSVVGHILRVPDPNDWRKMASCAERSRRCFASCRQHLSQSSCDVEVVDGELLFDEETFILYFLGQASEQLGSLSSELARTIGVRVQFESVAGVSQGCGGGGGCEMCR